LYSGLRKLGWTAKDDAAALVCGGAIHKVLEAFRNGVDAEACIDLFTSVYKDYSETSVPADNAREWRNVCAILREYMRRRPLTAVPYERIETIEQGYAARLVTIDSMDLDVWYYTRPDAVVFRDGVRCTLDTKSTGWLTRDWAKQWDVSAQVSGQLWTLSEVYGVPLVDAFIDGIELKTLNSSTRKCVAHKVAYFECATEHINFQHVLVNHPLGLQLQWRNVAATLAMKQHSTQRILGSNAENLIALEQGGLFTGACTKYNKPCTYYDFCLTGRHADRLPEMFTQSTFDLASQGPIMTKTGLMSLPELLEAQDV